MKFGFILPFFTHPRKAAELAADAESAGWDGFFVAEPVWGVDAWVTLTAAAMLTQRICLGTMLSPLSRMRPWKLASETASLDVLSNGRVIIGLGLGALDTGFAAFGEVTDRKARAELLDEGIDLLSLMYQSQPFKYQGKHFQVDVNDQTFPPIFYPPRPVQQPRIPLWVVGAWPHAASMRRVLRCDGLLPVKMSAKGHFDTLQPEDVAEMKAYFVANRSLTTPFDIVVEGQTLEMSTSQAVDKVQAWADAGATWWLEGLWQVPEDKVLTRLHQGPPRSST